MTYTTQSGWWHNPRLMRWECMDRRGQLSSWVVDEYVIHMSEQEIIMYLGSPLLEAMSRRP